MVLLAEVGQMERRWTLHGKVGARGRGTGSWQLLRCYRDAASWSRAVVLWDPELLMVDANAWM